MQLNWLHFCGLCQLIPLKLRSNTAQGCNHQSTCMPQLQLLCSASFATISLSLNVKSECKSKLSNWIIMHTTENVARPHSSTHSSRLQPSITCMPPLQLTCMFSCSGTKICDPEVMDIWSGQPWDNDRASWSSVLSQTQTASRGQKATVSLQDHRCVSNDSSAMLVR